MTTKPKTKHPFSKKDIQNAADFSNFAQMCKMVYWKTHEGGLEALKEGVMDDILLIAWKELHMISWKQTYD